MERELIIQLAREADWPDSLVAPVIMDKLIDFANLVTAHERERLEDVIKHLTKLSEIQAKSEFAAVQMIPAAVAAEREACAKLFPEPHKEYFGRDIQDAIRTRRSDDTPKL